MFSDIFGHPPTIVDLVDEDMWVTGVQLCLLGVRGESSIGAEVMFVVLAGHVDIAY